ncbi:MAG TPA: Na-translocating system protein MpsB, partial [Saprospiraceae bacterium]|nr:Na-translocating system protein MpsB [Saprospiraceae bacterium]
QDAFEWSYYDEVLAGVNMLSERKSGTGQSTDLNGSHPADKPPSFQGIFCIDEREDSLRRHIELVDPACETLGCPGFFGVEFYFQPEGGKFHEKLCPAPVTPKYLIKEYDAKSGHGHELLYTKKTHSPLEGFFYSLSMGAVAAFKMLFHLFRPKMSPAISDAFAHMSIDGKLHIEAANPPQMEAGLQLGFTVPEMATRVEGLLRGIGMVKNFAPIVYVVAHGSSSANNPHHGAHDCGACSGRPGATNARVFAFMANHPAVRAKMAENGLHIPAETQFVGAMHDTAADVIGYYDEDILLAKNAPLHVRNKAIFEDALDLNAKERSRRFASINTKMDIKKIREAIRKRSVSMFEPRPELGHGTNALCFVGTR